MAKDPKRQLLGKIARQKGQYFEQRLDGSFDYYSGRGYAVIEKTPEPMKVIKPEGNGRFLACYHHHSGGICADRSSHYRHCHSVHQEQDHSPAADRY